MATYSPLGQSAKTSGEDVRRNVKAKPLALRVMALLSLLAAIYLAISLLFSSLRSPRFVMPTFTSSSNLPFDHPDQYAREHGLLADFNRESWTMSEEQCDAAFHPLWQPLYQSKIYSDSKGGHTLKQQESIEKDLAAGLELTCVKILNNTLYIIDFHHSNGGSRAEAGISLLERAVVTSTDRIPDVRFCLSTQDQPVHNIFAMSRKEGEHEVWLAPDFNFWAWPEPGVGSYVGFRHKARQVEKDIRGWAGKKKQLFWRGATWIGEERKVLAEVASSNPWGNVHNIDWGGPKSDGVHPDSWESMEGHCKYAFLASPEGLSFSGRLKFLQNCESVILTRKAVYLQHWTHLFNSNKSSPLQNMVVLPPVDGNIDQSWRNAASEMDALIADDARAQSIAARSVEIFRDRYLSPAAVACYWRKAIKIFASSQRYTVSLDGSEVPWEAFSAQFYKMHIPIT
ncbi:hypothetical protein CBS101457_000043 [Exobasidium rhododendri]|nr:hypothetical protein CBS101457_000043 [Exobasidium rhododendri]